MHAHLSVLSKTGNGVLCSAIEVAINTGPTWLYIYTSTFTVYYAWIEYYICLPIASYKHAKSRVRITYLPSQILERCCHVTNKFCITSQQSIITQKSVNPMTYSLQLQACIKHACTQLEANRIRGYQEGSTTAFYRRPGVKEEIRNLGKANTRHSECDNNRSGNTRCPAHARYRNGLVHIYILVLVVSH